tara:strand:+ start:11850 stop:13067 length:1218 start_codon:yes stop_codon:yes gene_type:complete
MPIELTREELFKQVWARPMTKVAAEYEISDVALKKICTKHRIPVPGRGHWAKLAAGKPVQRGHFRALSDPAVNSIRIYGSAARSLPKAVKDAQQSSRAREKDPSNKVMVPAAPAELNPIVARTEKKLARAKPSDRGLVASIGQNLFQVEISPASVTRVIAFLNALVTAAESRGYKIIKAETALVFVVDDETLGFRIDEQVTRSEHTPTEAEIAAIEKWQKRQDRRRHSWQYADWTPRPAPPEWDYTPNGLLKVTLNEDLRYGYEGLRHTFGDGKTQRIENLANGILEAFSTWSVAIKAKRIEDERRKQELEERAQRQEEQRRRKALEDKRVEALARNLERWRERQQVLEFVAAVEAKFEAGSYDDPDAVREWIVWARRYADRIDPLSDGLPKLLQREDFSEWELG